MLKRTAASQLCPICRAQQPIQATHCAVCGASLLGTPTLVSRPTTQLPVTRAEPLPTPATWEDGDSDLYEGSLPTLPLSGVVVLLVTLLIIAGAVFLIARRAQSLPISVGISVTGTPSATLVAILVSGTPATPLPPTSTLPATNTRPPSLTPSITQAVEMPTLNLPTVTPVPPSPTITPTRGPCTQKAKTGDTLSALAARCGQYGQAIIATILDNNNMKDAGQLQIGQVITIPWPTPTGAPAAKALTSGTPGASAANVDPTLLPGQMWYTIKKGENAIIIAFKFHATIKILHDLNPEIAASFSQCDYGLPAGGQTCSVQVAEGERVRVPVPLPTPTLSPTPNGSETATPQPTATFNAPSSIGPGDNMLFGAAEFPVLRWSASDKLAAGQVYLVTVHDKTIDKTYRVPTKDLSFQAPQDWQPADGSRHVYEWFISIAVDTGGIIPLATDYTTEKRTFTWQGSGSPG